MSFIDEATVKQIYSFLNHPAFEGEPIVIMPDTHAGMGAVIGFTFKLNNFVIPNVVGVDIGCGIDAYCLGDIEVEFDRLDNFINTHIPSGFKVNKECLYSHKELKKLGLGSLDSLADKMKLDHKRVKNSIGSLGGGNHFIEIGKGEDGRKWLTVHSGSRNFGLQVAMYHQKRAKDYIHGVYNSDAYKTLEYLPLDEGGEGYLTDMNIAQIYASVNRDTIAKTIIEEFFILQANKLAVVKSTHNFIDMHDRIIRKGATRAYKNESGVIPFNMRDGMIIFRGKSNSEWNNSAPHGAGRILSRRKAKESLNLQKALKDMRDAGVYTTSLNRHSLDEAAGAYKNKELIIEMIEPTVDILSYVKPIYNFKAH